ncbi:TolC family protein [Deinococcus cellulosilyticus]|uniref:Transporter n=1 Tax=Deinococcus cellulosilyticus (strain DSM 18568 / NBRC 106333 / KACC 11606 / 5516J-15) TaxID=1223518 RepID=A0A511MVD2_DEIC1|nr:TolC family protein [Deinococcus cellulosilyticus]GEM44530.1 transporter [Deinococcus cellulosilyticus NBRC 106333 = KACC 11606]
MRVTRPLTLLLLMGSLHSLAAPVTPQDILNLIPASPAGQNLALSEQQAQQTLNAAQAALDLKVTAGGNYSLNTTDFTSTQQSGSINLGVSLPVLPWGSAFDSLKTTQRNYKAALLDAQDARNSLTSKLISGYYSILLAELDLRLAKQNQRLAEVQLQVVQQQKNQGTAAQEALLQAQQKLGTTQVNTLKAQNALDAARATLSNTLGRPIPEGEYTAAVLTGLPERTLEAWNALALSQRSDLQKAALKLEAAQDALNHALEDRWRPAGTLSTGLSSGAFGVDVSLNVQTGVLSSSASYAFQDGGPGGYKFSLSASIPIVDASQDATIQANQLAVQVAQATVESTKQSALLDVAQKYASVQVAALQVKNASGALAVAAEHLKVTEARVKAGLSTPLDLTSAQIALAQAEKDRTAAEVSLLTANLDLMNAAGQTYRGGVL